MWSIHGILRGTVVRARFEIQRNIPLCAEWTCPNYYNTLCFSSWYYVRHLIFFLIWLKLNSSSSTKSIDAVISENKFITSSLRGTRPLTISPSKSSFLLYSKPEKLSLEIIPLIALACLREFLLFRTDLYENSPFFANRKPGIFRSFNNCSNWLAISGEPCKKISQTSSPVKDLEI